MRQEQEQQIVSQPRLAVSKPVEVALPERLALRDNAASDDSRRWVGFALSLLTLPTAPFHEQFVLQSVLSQARSIGAEARFDASGNLIVDLPGRGALKDQQPLLVSAHTDHPGFWADDMVDDKLLWAHWIGRVPELYFAGASVEFFSGGMPIDGLLINPDRYQRNLSTDPPKAIRGKVIEVGEYRGEGDYARVLVEVDEPVESGSIGQWALAGCDLNDGIIRARSVDDVAGVAALVSLMCALKSAPTHRPTRLLFTRAEEAGFVGCIGYCQREANREHSLKHQVIGVEMSMSTNDAPVGSGPIVRVGDRRTVFDPAATSACAQIAQQLAIQDSDFVWQRRLMPGGTCESSVFQSYLGQAGAVCLPLGNYHNVDRRRQVLDREYIDVNDYLGLIRLLKGIATNPSELVSDTGIHEYCQSLYTRHQHLLSDPKAGPLENSDVV